MCVKACSGRLCNTTLRQHFAAAGVGHGAMAIGILLAWSALAVPDLLKADSVGKLSQNQASWVTNIAFLGALLAVLPTGILTDKYGRRLLIMLFALPVLVGWILIGVAKNFAVLALGRFLAGISGGAFSVILPLYVVEFAEPRIRGTIGFSFLQQIITGSLFVLLVGNVMGWSWRILGFKAMPISLAVFIFGYFLPESPQFLFSKNKTEEGKHALKWFRVTTDQELVEKELKEIEARLEITRLIINPPSVGNQIGISSILILLQQLSCCGHFIFGIIPLSEIIAGKTMNPVSVSLTITITSLVTMGIGSHLVDRIGRRPMLISSCMLMSLCSLSLGICLFAQNGESDIVINKLNWIRIISFTGYIFAFSFGLGPISWLVMAEIMPDSSKGFWTSLVTVLNWLPAFLLGKYSILLIYFLSLPGFLWYCTAVSIFATLFSYLFVPETSRKSLAEIQEFFEENLKMDFPI